MKKCIFIVGPTATGKTKLAILLAKKLNAEIINCDSMYLYKELNIGTAKPNKIEMQGIKHHIIDIINPNENFSVVDYQKLARPLIDKIQTPIIVGGTGLYIDSILYNYNYGNTFNLETRKELEEYLLQNGKEKLYQKLLDSDKFTKININDTKRVIRALEVYSNSNNVPVKEKELNDKINPIIIGLTLNREDLYTRINERVDKMFDENLLEEAKFIYDKYIKNQTNYIKAIGYNELFDYFDGKYDLNIAKEKIKQHSRNYAKRQLTWFKRNENINWFDINKSTNDEIINFIITKLNN